MFEFEFYMKALLFAILLSLPLSVAYAQSEFTQESILGFDPIHLALGITGAGLALRIGMAIARKERKFEVNQVFVSLVLGFFASLPIVATSLHNIPHEISDLNLFVMLVGMIATVMGIDAGVKSAAKKIGTKTTTPPVPPTVVSEPVMPGHEEIPPPAKEA